VFNDTPQTFIPPVTRTQVNYREDGATSVYCVDETSHLLFPRIQTTVSLTSSDLWLSLTNNRPGENGCISKLADFGLSYGEDHRDWFLLASMWTVFVPDITRPTSVNQYQIWDFHLVHRRAVTFTESRKPVLS
jgi:hypothetical protein